MLRVVEHLDPIVPARERHGGDAQPAVLHHDHGVGLLIHPHAALGGGELRRDPGAGLAGSLDDGREVGDLERLRWQSCPSWLIAGRIQRAYPKRTRAMKPRLPSRSPLPIGFDSTNGAPLTSVGCDRERLRP